MKCDPFRVDVVFMLSGGVAPGYLISRFQREESDAQ